MRTTFLLGAVLSCVGIATPSTATWNPATGCDVHERRLIAGTVDVNYHEVCTQAAVDALAAVHETDPYPLPCQYTDLGLGSCTPGNPLWPIELDPFTVVEAPPDRGYRYPLVRTATATSTVDTTQWLSPFDPGCTAGCPVQDQWPVCVTQNGSGVVSDIVSDPYDADGECPESYTRVGFCRGAAHYYERLATLGTSRSADRFYSFVHDEASCTPCGHEVVSAVETCKYLCRRYFGTLRFDTGTPSKWVEGTTQALGDHLVDVGGEMMPALTACDANCGPPNAATPATPWLSELGGAPDDKQNHWFFVQYGRGWSPNDNLDNWVRSYTVNRDKATAPANKCQEWVNSYCNSIIPAGQTAKRKTCKKNLLERTGGPLQSDVGVTPTMFNESGNTWVLNLPDDGRNVDVTCPSGSTPPDDEADGFCTHFYRGNMLCPKSCYFRGNDGEFNGHHLCGAAVENKCLAGGYCDQERAVCVTCTDDDGDPINCPSLTIVHPADTDQNPDDGTVTTTASQAGVVALFKDGNGNPIGPGGSPHAVGGVWVATPQWVYGQTSFGFGHWVSQPVTLVQGENIVYMSMRDQYLNAASAQIKIIKP